MNYTVYVLRCPFTTNVKYVGITKNSIEQRLERHLNYAKNANKNYLSQTWLRSLIEQDVVPFIQSIETNLTESDAKVVETWWIRYFKKKGITLKNTTKGGETMSPLAMQRAKEANEKQKLKVKQYSMDGKLVKIFNCISDAAEDITGDRRTNGKLSQVCKGKRHFAYGFVWRYIEDDFNTHDVFGRKKYTEEQIKKYSSSKKGNKNPQFGKQSVKAIPVIVENINTLETILFPNKGAAKEYVKTDITTLNKKLNTDSLIKNQYRLYTVQ